MKINNLQALIVVEELLRLGVDYFCLAPGSRATPLVAQIAKQTKAKDFIHFDERGLAFHALGYAKATKKPAVVVITSGSSLANVFPAIIEACQSKVPLLLISGDRPFELTECGSNQAIDQVKFYHKYVVWHADIPLCEEKLPLKSILSTIDYAYAQSLAGPVHLNLRFREPFFQDQEVSDLDFYNNWKDSSSPHQKVVFSQKKIDPNFNCSLTQKGAIILGREVAQEDLSSISLLAKQLNYPIFSDLLAQNSSEIDPYTIKNYEFIHSKKAPFETVLQFGHTFLSKKLLQYLKANPPKHYYLISKTLTRSDPNHLSATLIESSPTDFCQKMLLDAPFYNTSWLESWREDDTKLSIFLSNFFRSQNQLNELSLSRVLFEQIDQNAALYIASSMPIRDAHYFADRKSHHHIFCNRGASGTDGNIATALGISQGLNVPITCVIGDIAFLYDLNSLAQIKEIRHSPTFIVINNQGCGIFSFLPISSQKDIFKRYFQTSHDFDFIWMAKQFGLNYFNPKTIEEFSQTLNSKGPNLIEVKTNAQKNFQQHQEIFYAIEKALD